MRDLEEHGFGFSAVDADEFDGESSVAGLVADPADCEMEIGVDPDLVDHDDRFVVAELADGDGSGSPGAFDVEADKRF